jgi:hypothetical protein
MFDLYNIVFRYVQRYLHCLQRERRIMHVYLRTCLDYEMHFAPPVILINVVKIETAALKTFNCTKRHVLCD